MRKDTCPPPCTPLPPTGGDQTCSSAEVDRRRFLQGAAVAGLAAGGLLGCGKQESARSPRKDEPARPEPNPGPMDPPRKPDGPRSKVVQVTSTRAYDAKQKLSQPTVQEMVDRAVMELTGKTSPQAAWSSLFSPSEKVGLKPNMLGREVCWTNPETVAAIVAGLRSAGVRDENMYLWDLKAFDISPLYTHFKDTKINVKTSVDWGYGDQRFKIDSGPPARLVKPLLKVDAVVNIPLVKDHGLAGVTCALKSVFGSIDNPADQHTNRKGEKTCDPMAAELSALPEVRKKMRLVLTDAFQIIIEGGPRGVLQHRRTLNSVFAAFDPVAMDRVAWTILDAHRKQAGHVPLMERKEGKEGRRGRPLHVLTAEKLGLGTADPARIDHVVKQLG
jgi:uncharacterized protein (DUF362 family)